MQQFHPAKSNPSCNSFHPSILLTPKIGERHYLPKEVFKIWRASNYIYPKSRLHQAIRRGMADEHSLPRRLETKVMMPFPGFVSPASVLHTWDLLPHLGNACLDIGTLHQTQLAPVSPAPLSFGGCDSFGSAYERQLDLADFICTLE